MKKDPPERYKHYVGKYIHTTCHPSSVSGVILDEMHIVDELFWSPDDSMWMFRVLNMIPKKNKNQHHDFMAKQFVRCVKEGISYDPENRPLFWNRITEVSLDDIRQRRKILLVKKIMES